MNTSSASTPQPRQPAGIPSGGEWTTREYAESGLTLTVPSVAEPLRPMHVPGGMVPGRRIPSVDTLVAVRHDGSRYGTKERHEALLGAGYVAPTYLLAVDDPRRTDKINAWWEQKSVAAEHAVEGGYPKMPDDYTPSRGGGQSIDGRRRTHRMKYTSEDITLRMPSATSVKRYATEVGGTFDVPISIRNERTGGTLAGWVRVTRTGPSAFATSGLGFGNGTVDAKVAESVSAVLESRRPSRGLREAGDLLERRRARLAAQLSAEQSTVETGGDGATLAETTSSWVSGVGYDDRSGVMVTKTGAGTYGHYVDRDVFEQVRDAYSPGAAFNKLVKGNPRAAVEQCDECGRFFSAVNAHACPTLVDAPVDAASMPVLPARDGARSGNAQYRRRAAALARAVVPAEPRDTVRAGGLPPAGDPRMDRAVASATATSRVNVPPSPPAPPER